MKKRNEPLRTQRPQSFFFRKAKNTIFFGEYFGNSVSSRSSAVYAYFLILGMKIFPYLYPPLVKNGNSHIIRKTKYLIIGADNEKFDENGMRVLHTVDYKIPEQSDLVKWLNSASSPAVIGFESELVPFQGVNLWIMTIPPTFELHETTRELNASGHFQKHVVFMRRDEHTAPASVREGITIQQLT